MKKLALVLGSLLVIGSAASAKEVMPAPMPEPEVKIVEKPVEVIVYRDRVVEAPAKWKPNGYVSVKTKTVGEIEGTGAKDTDRTWKGTDPKTRLEVKASANITENQNVEFRLRDWYGLTHRNHGASGVDEYYLQHTYNFGKLGSSKVDMALESRFQRNEGVTVYSDDEESLKISDNKFIRERLAFNFADYLFQNDYVKTTNAVLAPEIKYAWGTWKYEDKVAGTTETLSNHFENYGLYADYQADIIGGFTFEAEFEDLYSHTVYNVRDGKDVKGNTGAVEFTLGRPTALYEAGKHKVVFNPELVYATSWAWNKKTVEDGLEGIERSNGKKERWGNYTAKFEPQLSYSYKATDYINLMAKLGAEYVNRNEERHSASHWRWQPYAELGMRVNF
ncbi:hypothetical protein IX325_000815 [Fusobacterium necrophorum subsp. funduliforme]|uniref:major outer membrane protein FomA n=1 Tax=Fusobacterium necrophorum TaxID=859 RepID=UPI001B8C4AFB|nr:porin [Fusobacterium necrophorum]MBR8722507.1 hypothetical protein [Fusobacterium necrophorum subsp. funduliforme]